MTTEECLARIEAQLKTIITHQGTMIELMHEWLDRPRPRVHLVLDISAWSNVQLRRIANAIVYAATHTVRSEEK